MSPICSNKITLQLDKVKNSVNRKETRLKEVFHPLTTLNTPVPRGFGTERVGCLGEASDGTDGPELRNPNRSFDVCKPTAPFVYKNEDVFSTFRNQTRPK